MKQKAKVAVVIGRFQIGHKGHEALFSRAHEIAERLVIIIGSIDKPRTIKDPFSFSERREMLTPYFTDGWDDVIGVQDSRYNDEEWVYNVQRAVTDAIGEERDVVLVGHSKDESSFYLKMFPQWKFEEVEKVGMNESATVYRDFFFGAGGISTDLPPKTRAFLKTFVMTQDFLDLAEEWVFINKYKASWADAPYAPTFVTADAVVVQAGHILLVQRRSAPGKGLWAFPGGFVNQKEKVFDAAIRELKEETKLKVPEAVLRGSLRISRVFDDPERSLRGRTITHAFLFNLQPMGTLPVVKGSDDAIKAKWFSLYEFFNMRNVMFEDHFDIGINLVGTL